MRAKFKEMLFNPLTNNFNYTTRIPEYSLIPLASNNNELAITLLSKALTNFNTVNVNSKSVNKQDLVDEVNNLTSKDNNQEYKGTFIENFPLNKEHALNFDKKTDGINLFVNINFVN